MISQSTLDSAVAQLKPILRSSESPSDDEELARIASARDSVVERFAAVFSSEAVDSITAEEFRSFLAIENNHHWPLHRQGSVICADMNRLRRALGVLLDESRPVAERLNEIRDREGPLRISGLGKAALTAILHVAHPDLYAVWNNTVSRQLSLDRIEV